MRMSYADKYLYNTKGGFTRLRSFSPPLNQNCMYAYSNVIDWPIDRRIESLNYVSYGNLTFLQYLHTTV